MLQWAHSGINSLYGGRSGVWMFISVAIHPLTPRIFQRIRGPRYPEKIILVDSNYDWGQDLKFLAKRLPNWASSNFRWLLSMA